MSLQPIQAKQLEKVGNEVAKQSTTKKTKIISEVANLEFLLPLDVNKKLIPIV